MMPWYKRLRWRLIAPQFLAVVVGVGTMVLAVIVILNSAPGVINPYLVTIAANPDALTSVEQTLLVLFRNAVLLSVGVAAFFALVAGIISSVVLWRIIIAPLQRVAASSKRVANGRYVERVEVPDNSGEAMAQLVISFNQMAQALAQVEEQRVGLLGNISHELRTPLTGLKGYLEGLLDGLFPANEETFAWMTQEVDRLHRLVDDIQNLSRIEAGQFPLQIETFELTAVVRRVVAQLQPQAQDKAQSLSLSAPERPYHVYADADRTAQVLFNLVGNAIRYTKENGRIEIILSHENSHATIDVRDNGIGIPPGDLPYIFERFYRVDQSRARASGGIGIGLTISRHLAWTMGGDLTAVSAGNRQGSCFTLTLPKTVGTDARHFS